MVMYGRGPCDGNQLEWILSQFNARKGVRRSMLQATTFDPDRDHVASAQLGFPCLQQVSFEPTTAGLVTNAFYATQQIFDKAYGNYLGLTQLGAFMAREMGMPLARLNIMVGIAKLERINKSDNGSCPSGRRRSGPSVTTSHCPGSTRSGLRCDRGSNTLSAKSPKAPREASARLPPEASFQRSQRSAPGGTSRRGSPRDTIDAARADHPEPLDASQSFRGL